MKILSSDSRNSAWRMGDLSSAVMPSLLREYKAGHITGVWFWSSHQFVGYDVMFHHSSLLPAWITYDLPHEEW